MTKGSWREANWPLALPRAALASRCSTACSCQEAVLAGIATEEASSAALGVGRQTPRTQICACVVGATRLSLWDTAAGVQVCALLQARVHACASVSFGLVAPRRRSGVSELPDDS
jgi:hypothetical protein